MANELSEKLIHLLVHAPAGGYQFQAGALDTLRAMAEEIESGEELYGLVHELIRFSRFLAGPQKSEPAARELFAVVEEVAEKLAGLAQKDANATRNRGEAIHKQVQQQRKALSLEAPADPGLPSPSSGVGLRRGKVPGRGGYDGNES